MVHETAAEHIVRRSGGVLGQCWQAVGLHCPQSEVLQFLMTPVCLLSPSELVMLDRIMESAPKQPRRGC